MSDAFRTYRIREMLSRIARNAFVISIVTIPSLASSSAAPNSYVQPTVHMGSGNGGSVNAVGTGVYLAASGKWTTASTSIHVNACSEFIADGMNVYDVRTGASLGRVAGSGCINETLNLEAPSTAPSGTEGDVLFVARPLSEVDSCNLTISYWLRGTYADQQRTSPERLYFSDLMWTPSPQGSELVKGFDITSDTHGWRINGSSAEGKNIQWLAKWADFNALWRNGQGNHVLISLDLCSSRATAGVYVNDHQLAGEFIGGTGTSGPYMLNYGNPNGWTLGGQQNGIPGQVGEFADVLVWISPRSPATSANLVCVKPEGRCAGIKAGQIPVSDRRNFIDVDGRPVDPAIAISAYGGLMGDEIHHKPCIVLQGPASRFATNSGACAPTYSSYPFGYNPATPWSASIGSGIGDVSFSASYQSMAPEGRAIGGQPPGGVGYSWACTLSSPKEANLTSSACGNRIVPGDLLIVAYVMSWRRPPGPLDCALPLGGDVGWIKFGSAGFSERALALGCAYYKQAGESDDGTYKISLEGALNPPYAGTLLLLDYSSAGKSHVAQVDSAGGSSGWRDTAAPVAPAVSAASGDRLIGLFFSDTIISNAYVCPVGMTSYVDFAMNFYRGGAGAEILVCDKAIARAGSTGDQPAHWARASSSAGALLSVTAN